MPNASHPASAKAGAVAGTDFAAVARFLRGLADRVEHDPAFAQQIAALLIEAGLLPGAARATPRKRAANATVALPREAGAATEAAGLDIFGLLREQGEAGLRARLGALGAGELHEVIRTHRLDPARISTRWTSQARLVDLVIAQVRARADHGKAFARL
jgi:hypothetical protein